MDAAAKRTLAQIAAVERARDRRFVDGLARGMPRVPREYGRARADRVALLAALVMIATLVFGAGLFTVVAGVVSLAAGVLCGRGRPVW